MALASDVEQLERVWPTLRVATPPSDPPQARVGSYLFRQDEKRSIQQEAEAVIAEKRSIQQAVAALEEKRSIQQGAEAVRAERRSIQQEAEAVIAEKQLLPKAKREIG
ncbi:hypothetical protein LTR08_003650 [Meristemomyces frigidus]|nr:hypothetical protein LTR08_003650 [Meristemomyces frigidus]